MFSCLVFLQGTCTPFTARPCRAHTRRHRDRNARGPSVSMRTRFNAQNRSSPMGCGYTGSPRRCSCRQSPQGILRHEHLADESRGARNNAHPALGNSPLSTGISNEAIVWLIIRYPPVSFTSHLAYCRDFDRASSSGVNIRGAFSVIYKQSGTQSRGSRQRSDHIGLRKITAPRPNEKAPLIPLEPLTSYTIHRSL